MRNIDYALRYADLFGWAVFPAHTIINGACSCHKPGCTAPGKHPISTLVPHGVTQASKDHDQIISWWLAHPEANIGIATGAVSGFLVVDIDDNGAIPAHALPDSVEQITGSGGRHVLYAYPRDGAHYKTNTRTGDIEGVDSRADGGYIIAPPSRHISGASYEWEASSDPFDGIKLAAAPDWWLDCIRDTSPRAQSSELPTWNPSGALPDDIAQMLDSIPSDDYETWRNVGLAMHHTAPAEGLAYWDWWSAKSANYDRYSVLREWDNFTRRAHLVHRPLTIDTIKRLAESNGYISAAIIHGAAIVDSLAAGQQERIAEQVRAALKMADKIDRPQITPSRGLISDISEYINKTAIWPQPDLATANAIAFLGAIIGRKFRTEYGGYSNIYTVGLCDSGGGKDHSRKIINNLAILADAGHYMGGENFASGQSIVKALERNPAQLFQLDEFGKFVAAATSGKASDYKKDIITRLMILYSSAGSIYQGTEYADQKTNPRTPIVNPCACVYGTSTPGSFWGGLSSGESVDGFLSRLLIIETDSYREVKQRPNLSPPSQELILRIRELAEYQPSGGGNLSAGDAVMVPMDNSVADDIDRLDEHLTERMQSEAERSIYSRVVEASLKISMIYAVSVNIKNPRIDNAAWLYGRELAMWSANLLANKCKDVVADSDFESACKQAAAIIKESGEEGITERDLSRSAAKLRAMPKPRRKEVFEVLETDYGIGMKHKIKTGAGRPTAIYYFEGN